MVKLGVGFGAGAGGFGAGVGGFGLGMDGVGTEFVLNGDEDDVFEYDGLLLPCLPGTLRCLLENHPYFVQYFSRWKNMYLHNLYLILYLLLYSNRVNYLTTDCITYAGTPFSFAPATTTFTCK